MGRLARWLRMMGFDSRFFTGADDARMVVQALAEGRVLLTRDTELMKRRVISRGRLKAVLMASEEPEQQMRQLLAAFDLECNQPLAARRREEVAGRVPPYVYATQLNYMECPACRRIYWRGTHWERMTKKLDSFIQFP